MLTRREDRPLVPEIPGVFHHADEILVVVNGRANAAVVVDEVVFRYLQTATSNHNLAAWPIKSNKIIIIIIFLYLEVDKCNSYKLYKYTNNI